jgi:hypothetical protein
MNNQKAPNLVTPDNKGERHRFNSVREMYFLLCNSCFWCASYLSKSLITNCPVCDMTTLESMPVFNNEEYRIDYNSRQGMMLEFKKIPAIC